MGERKGRVMQDDIEMESIKKSEFPVLECGARLIGNVLSSQHLWKPCNSKERKLCNWPVWKIMMNTKEE